MSVDTDHTAPTTSANRAALWPAFLPPSQHGNDGRCAVSADGVRIRFADGADVLCGTSGLWNTPLGYGNRHVAEATYEALRNASYLNAFRYENVYARRAAAELIDVADPAHYARVIFSTSGGAANDTVSKLVRQTHALRGAAGRKIIVGMTGSYHGLTFGSFALTGEDLGQQMYGVDTRLVRHVPPNDLDGLRATLSRIGNSVGAIIAEPVLGTGTLPLTDEYIAELCSLRDEYGFLLVADEVATGFGRTGSFFASQRWPSPPDLLITSKGLTNGTQACAAILVSNQVARTFGDADAVLGHAETQAGTAVACAAISATISEMHRLDAVAAGKTVGDALGEALTSLQQSEDSVAAVSGMGCFRSITLSTPDGAPLEPSDVPQLVAAIRDAGAVVHPGPSGVQLVPALVYSRPEVRELIQAVSDGIGSFWESRTNR
ncbi:aspartate aminotransferase family protein [Rhodococcus sp. 14-2483-1-1]|uniref:daptide-type RiPP biosynthesis aminotransferase n=1 Tax=Rhodococcus sp. 14-2483-1-1 TaxID=2023148 RepID=UPI000B9ADD98|nr:daptide-type RiPP biosynthesis aminotransferase [Rhodococcus sp. 14-2483-1-1]OZF36878.1 aspartate aminotransferase family protein [Rhodococcus sp. 14-2483-1-1]